MARPPRQVDDCPHRSPSPEGDARCDLLRQITGVDDHGLGRVGLDACEACCRSFPPSAEDPNPVVASLVYTLSWRVMEQGGVAGCDRPRAEALNRWAMANLPSEEDEQGGSTGESLPPAPTRRSGPRVRSWAVGVTTAPRGVPTLGDCLASLAVAGWDCPRLFVDGDAPIPEAFSHLPRTDRTPRVGAWPNYYLGLAELLMREPEADAYLMVEDDALFADQPGLRTYLEGLLWPGPRPGVVSLFCSRAYTRPRPGWYAFEGTWAWCALAFVFPRDLARRFLADPDVVGHRWTRARNPLADTDWRVGRWAETRGVPVYFPTPSLVQHIGEVSSLWPGVRLQGDRLADRFVGRGTGDFPGQ